MSDEDLKQENQDAANPTEQEPPSANAELEETEETAMAKMQADLEAARDANLRARADLENYRKRVAREKEEAIKYANASFLEKLIPILDNFELGLAAARNSAEHSPILAGMEMVAKQIYDFLGDLGVTPIDATNDKFDPHLHEAIGQEESQKIKEGYVIRQMRRGFKLKDRLLRPANVIVSKGKGDGGA